MDDDDGDDDGVDLVGEVSVVVDLVVGDVVDRVDDVDDVVDLVEDVDGLVCMVITHWYVTCKYLDTAGQGYSPNALLSARSRQALRPWHDAVTEFVLTELDLQFKLEIGASNWLQRLCCVRPYRTLSI